MTENSKTAFQNIDASVEAIDSGLGITEVESLCMNCRKNVIYRLIKLKIY
jgi:hypothetical protein